MGDLFGLNSSSQSTSQQQVGVESTGGGSTATVGGGTSGNVQQGNALSLKDANIDNSHISITTADPGIVSEALNSVNAAQVNSGAALQALQDQQHSESDALTSVESLSYQAGQASAVYPGQQQSQQSQNWLTGGGGSNWLLWISIAVSIIGIFVLLRKK